MPTNKTDQLKAILGLLSASVSKDDFLQAMQTLVTHIKAMKTGNEEQWSLVKSTISMMGETLKKENAASLAGVKEDLTAKVEKALKEQENGMKFIYDKVAKLEDGEDGEDGDDGHTPTQDELLAIIKPLIPTVENGKDALVDEEAIIAKVLARIPRQVVRTGGAPAVHPMKFLDLSAQTDGSKKVFSVPKNVNGIVLCSDFPSVLMEGNGFTMNASRTVLTLTVTNAPSSGAQLLFQYSALFNTTT